MIIKNDRCSSEIKYTLRTRQPLLEVAPTTLAIFLADPDRGGNGPSRKFFDFLLRIDSFQFRLAFQPQMDIPAVAELSLPLEPC